jgi:DUF4097 and DUF4098 domain-containing protein YvlB
VDLDLGEDLRSNRVSLDVRSHDADEVWAVADLSGLGASSVKFRIEHDDQVVRLYGRAGGLMSWLFGGPGVSVRIWVPRAFSVDLRCPTGSIRIEEISGEIRARTHEGAIDVNGAEGRLHLRTREGAVGVTEVQGDVTVRAGEGPIELSWVTGNVEIRTGRGDIQARHIDGQTNLRTDEGEIAIRDLRGPADALTERGAVYASFDGPPAGRLETRRGSVEVTFPDHVGLQLDARTGHGTVELGGGVRARGQREANRFVGAINGGGSPLWIYTTRGTIRVRRR